MKSATVYSVAEQANAARMAAVSVSILCPYCTKLICGHFSRESRWADTRQSKRHCLH